MSNIDWGQVIQTVITIIGALAGVAGSHSILSKKIDNINKK